MLWFCTVSAFVLLPSTLSSNIAGRNYDLGQLVTVVVVFRHGDRIIINPYPNDPYKNTSYWPVGWGQLTNEGKRQEFELGRWLRNRYANFLPDEYSEKDIYVRSTDVDRTLMSAEVNLAGLYPPQVPQVWDQNIPWQPIPVHTKPENEDVILAMRKSCPKYDLLFAELMRSPEIAEINRLNSGLYEYIAKNAGVNITDFDALEFVYDNLVIEALHNFTLPAWTKAVFPDKMKPLAEFSFAVPCYTPEMARLRAGPFFQELLDHLFNITSGVQHKEKTNRKLWMYSGHDTTVANILQSLNIFEYHCPPYASTILFELRYLNHEYFVNVFYKNSTEPQAMTLKGCDFDCPLEEFLKLLQPIMLDVDGWAKECELSPTSYFEFVNANEIAVAATTFLVCMALITIASKMIYGRRKKSSMIYLRLPDDDEQA